MKKILIIAFVVVLVLAGGAGLWYVRAAGDHGPRLRTAEARRGELVATINATGTIEPEQVIDVGAQVAGQILEFGSDPRDSSRPIDYGSPVDVGTVLARIDPQVYQAQVDQAKANLQKAQGDLLQMQAKVYQTKRDYGRADELYTGGVALSATDYDTAKAAYETAESALEVGQATIAQNKAALQQAQLNLDYCTIKSPVKGVIVDRRVNVGQTVVSSLNAPSLFLIAKDLTRLQVWASVNEADVGHIHPGQTVQFTVDAYPNQTFTGVVAPDQPRLNATMNQNVVTYTVVVNVDNSDGKLLPYLTANLQFEVSRLTDALLVPNAALRWQPSPEQVAPDIRAAYVKSLTQSAGDPADNSSKPTTKDRQDRGRGWVQDGSYVRPVRVQIGLSDGVNTEITGGDLQESMPVVVGEEQDNGGSGVSNPFTPQLFGGKKQS
jgi:HlyD family secretion protein